MIINFPPRRKYFAYLSIIWAVVISAVLLLRFADIVTIESDILFNYFLHGFIFSYLLFPLCIYGRRKTPPPVFSRIKPPGFLLAEKNRFFVLFAGLSLFFYVLVCIRLIFTALLLDRLVLKSDYGYGLSFSVILGLVLSCTIFSGKRCYKKIAGFFPAMSGAFNRAKSIRPVKAWMLSVSLSFPVVYLGIGFSSFIFLRYICGVSEGPKQLAGQLAVRLMLPGILAGNFLFLFMRSAGRTADPAKITRQ